MNKFNKLYKLIMQKRYNNQFRNDPGEYFGQSTYNLNKVGEGQVQLYGRLNGQPVINPMTGQPIKWQVVATHYNCFDAITGEKLVAPRTVFRLPFGNSKKNAKYVAIETYINAYENNDEETIVKLQAIGLQPGYKFNF